MAEFTEKQIDEAIGRLAHTPDGMLLYRRLVRIAMSLAPLSDGGGALPAHEGRRRFALELKSLMDANVRLTPSDRSDADSDAISIAADLGSAKSVAFSGTRGAVRRVEPYPEPERK